MSYEAEVLEMLAVAGTTPPPAVSYRDSVTILRDGLEAMGRELSVVERTQVVGHTQLLLEGLTRGGYPARLADEDDDPSAKPSMRRGRFGFTSYWPDRFVEVSSRLPDAGALYVLLHEAGHVLGRHGDRLMRSGKDMQAEVEAESTAWLAGSRLGIDGHEQCMLYLTAGGWGAELAGWFDSGVADTIARRVAEVSHVIIEMANGRG